MENNLSNLFIQLLRLQNQQQRMGNVRDNPNLKKSTNFVRKQLISYASSSMCGWRQFMEDTHICEPTIDKDQNISVFAVFDGHGGPQVAKFASEHFVNCLVGNGYFITKNYQRALIEVIMHLDSMMLAKAGVKQLRKLRDEQVDKNNATPYQGQCMAGSTANIVLLTKDYVYCANVGDSRSIAILKQSKSSKPKVKELSIDQKPDDEEQRNRIIRAGGTVQFGRINNNLNLSRALGDFSFKANRELNPEEQMVTALPQIVKANRKQIKYILVGCDGIWQRKSNEQMAKWLSKRIQAQHNNLGKVLEKLFDQQVSQDPDAELGMDNMTAILISLNN